MLCYTDYKIAQTITGRHHSSNNLRFGQPFFLLLLMFFLHWYSTQSPICLALYVYMATITIYYCIIAFLVFWLPVSFACIYSLHMKRNWFGMPLSMWCWTTLSHNRVQLSPASVHRLARRKEKRINKQCHSISRMLSLIVASIANGRYTCTQRSERWGSSWHRSDCTILLFADWAHIHTIGRQKIENWHIHALVCSQCSRLWEHLSKAMYVRRSFICRKKLAAHWQWAHALQHHIDLDATAILLPLRTTTTKHTQFSPSFSSAFISIAF